MENHILVEIIIPKLERSYDVNIPIGKKVGNIIVLLNKSLSDVTGIDSANSKGKKLYNYNTKELYDLEDFIFKTDIRNGTRLVFI